MKMNGNNGKRLKKVSGIILALLFIALLSSCSPVSDTLTLCRVSLDNPSSRSLTATVDPLGNNVYVKTIYKGTGERYTNLSESEYCKIPTEGIVVSQGLWEVQAIFSSDGKPSTYTDTEAKTLPGGTSGVIFINLSTQSIPVKLKLDEGTGSAVISYYTLSGTVPENPSIYINLYKYNGTKFEIHDGTNFSGPQDSDTNVFSNTITNLPTGYYYATITVKSSSTVKAVDTIGFVVRKGLTTRITGSCSNYYSTSGGSIYLDPVEEKKPVDSTKTTIDIKPTTNNQNEIVTVSDEIESGKTYVIQGVTNTNTNTTEISLGHSTSKDPNSPRLNVPKNEEIRFALNLNGTVIYLSKLQNNGNAQYESALVADLTSDSFMTIYNNNTSGNSATFAILEEGTKDKIVDRRLQSNILVNASQLNIVGKNATDPISNGDIVIIGPEDSHTNLLSGEYRQGAINLEGTGKTTINLDGNVKVNGLCGISSWHVQSTTTTTTKETSLSGNQNINITLRNGASIDTVSTSASEVQTSDKHNNKNYTDFASAHGIYIYGDSTTPPGGTINITLDGASITTNSAGKVVSAGIRIENFSGKVTINITDSTITATNGYAMYFSNCPDVTINDNGNNTIVGEINGAQIGKNQ